MSEPPADAPRLRVAIISDRSPRAVARLMQRLQGEVPGVHLCGLVHTDGGREVRAASGGLGKVLLRFLHACPLAGPGNEELDKNALFAACRNTGVQTMGQQQADSPEARGFLTSLDLDMLLLYAASVPSGLQDVALRRGLLCVSGALRPADSENAPASLQIHTTLFTPSGQQRDLQHMTHAVEPYDTGESLRLKLDLLARDLLIQSLRGLRTETSADSPAPAKPSTPGLPVALPLQPSQPFPLRSQRAAWKLLVRTLVFAPFLLFRNWYRRITATFPVVILYHHLVSDRPHRMGISTEWFQRHVRYLKEHYRVVPLPEAIAMLRTGRVNCPTVVLTFDDGYRDKFVNLRAVSEEEGISATLFVCTDHMRSGSEFAHDVRKGERGFLPLNWEQVELLQRSGLDIGSHTRTHFDCGAVEEEALQAEIVGSRDELQQALGAQPQFFSFPWGNPQNMSTPAVERARHAYPHVFSACGGGNPPGVSRDHGHLKRRCHPSDLWELELTVQGILEMEALGAAPDLENRFA